MKKVAIFGKPANGKSTLGKKLALSTGIELYALDSILYQPSGEEISRETYNAKHAEILAHDEWIIEGFAPLSAVSSFFERLETADTLIYLDLPYSVTYWLVIKRFLKGLFVKPDGWPEGSSIFKGTLDSFRVLKLCPKFWNQAFVERLEALAVGKSLYVIRSTAELTSFIKQNTRLPTGSSKTI